MESEGQYDVESPPLPEFRDHPVAGRVLCFAPHPDDEIIGPGGALCLHRRQGDPVRVVVGTDGVAGDPEGRFDRASYRDRRRGESRAGLATIGVEDVVFWGLPDSCVVHEDDLVELADRVARQVTEFAAEVVYLPWSGEVNSDHRALHLAAVRGLAQCGFRGVALGYEVWTAMIPDVVLDITAVAEVKRRALSCYETQLSYVDYAHPIFGLHAHRSLLFLRGRGYCEGFRTESRVPSPESRAPSGQAPSVGPESE